MKETLKHPIRFKPYLKRVVWGGRRIADLKQCHVDYDDLGESWEISSYPGMESVVDDGSEFAGMKLSDLVARFGSRLVGTDVYARYGDYFPILLKIIDAHRDLSLQVHPDDELARRRNQLCGKTEMWYVLEAEKDASIHCGFSAATDFHEVRRRIADNSVMQLVDSVPSRPGQVFYVPAGTIHAIGAGNMVVEIQQTSDITYRLYDYNRADENGSPRPLHLAESEEAIDFTYPQDRSLRGTLMEHTRSKVIDTEYFKVDFINLDEGGVYPVDHEGRTFAVLLTVEGSLDVIYDGGTAACRKGFSLFMPAEMGRFDIKGRGKGLLFYC